MLFYHSDLETETPTFRFTADMFVPPQRKHYLYSILNSQSVMHDQCFEDLMESPKLHISLKAELHLTWKFRVWQ